MNTLIRLMPDHDPHWHDKWAEAKELERLLLMSAGPRSAESLRDLKAVREAIDRAFNSRFRTTAEYRDFYFARAREMLENEGIDMPLPAVPDDARVEDVDRVLSMVWRAVEVTNTENF